MEKQSKKQLENTTLEETKTNQKAEFENYAAFSKYEMVVNMFGEIREKIM